MKMSIAGDFLYVSHVSENKISVIDTRTDLLYKEITTSGGLIAVEAIPEKNKIYAAIFESDGVDVYAADTGLYEKTIILPDAELLQVSTSNQGYSQRGTFSFLTGGWALDYNPNNELLYVASYNGDVIYVIDTNVDQVGETITVADDPYTVKVDTVTDKVIVASLAGNAVTILTPVELSSSPGNFEHEISSELKTGSAPWCLDIDSINHLAYVSHRGSSYLSVINIIDEVEVAQIPLSGRVQCVAVDEVEHMVYTTLFTSNDLVKINGETFEIIDTIEVESSTWDLIVEPKSHKIYASYQGDDRIAVLSPESYRETLPVITQETPVLVVGHIIVHGQDVRVFAPNLVIEESSIVAGLVSSDGGNLSVQIPRSLLVSEQGDDDTKFSVMVDGNSVTVNEIQGNDKYRDISFFVPEKSTSLEIKGSDVLPAPKQSVSDGWTEAQIMCQEKVWIESTNGKIACVSGSTALKLEERGWGTILE
jgi:YVTN family beta-propeller protein